MNLSLLFLIFWQLLVPTLHTWVLEGSSPSLTLFST